MVGVGKWVGVALAAGVLVGCGGTEDRGGAAPGGASADSGRKGVALVGFDASEALIGALSQGKIQGLVVQNPVLMGELGVKTMVQHLEKQPVEPKVSTGEAVVTPDNYKEDAIARLIHPARAENVGGASLSGPKSKKWKVIVIPKGTTHEFWEAVHAGAVKAASELGNVEVVWLGPQKEDERCQQIELVQSAVAAGVDGIVLAPLDAHALVDPVEAAVAKGIPVVVFDSGLDSDKIVSFVATDNYHGGVLAARRLGEVLGGKGRVILLRYAVGSESTEQREKGFTDTLAKEFPGLTMVSDTEYAGPTFDSAQQKSESLLTRYRGQVDGIFCPNESSTFGMMRALEGAGDVALSVLLEMTDVRKAFGATRALDGVSLSVQAGEVRALIGENGAGKSTLMKVLSGAYRPDAGSMTLDGSPYAPRGPREALARGVAMIYQELALAPALSVEANILLGQERVKGGWLRLREHRRIAAEALALLEHPDIRPEARVRDLGVGAQQLVEVARALVSQARVIVFDEPTSSLSERDADRLFTIIERLKERGLAIIYISHFLEEVRRVARTYTVLRDGRSVAEGALAGTDLRTIIGHMVGRDLGELFPRVPHTPGEPILELSGFRASSRGRPTDLTLRRGEILGLAGLVGAGRTRMVRAIFGLGPVVSGRVRVAAVEGGYARPRERIEEGVGFLSEDRKGEGLALGLSIEDNMTYPGLRRHARGGWLRLGERRGEVARWMARLRIAAAGPAQPVVGLSGGNQQKVALARLLHQHADVLLLDEPTRGIDVGSKAEIYRLMGELAAQGKAILVVSSYLPELFGICDRIAVMSRGTMTEALPVDQWTEHRVMEVATRGAD